MYVKSAVRLIDAAIPRSAVSQYILTAENTDAVRVQFGSGGELLAKARGSFWRAWGLGMGNRPGLISPLAAKGLWEVLVRPVLEYGSEVDSGKWEDAELLQRVAGRMCLGVGTTIPNTVVRGGAWPPGGGR